MKMSYLFSLMSIIVICSACQSKQATFGLEEVTSQPKIFSTTTTILPTATKPIESLTRPTVTKVLPTAILSPTTSPVFEQVSSPNPQPQLTGRLVFSSVGPDINKRRFRLYTLNLVDNTLNQLTFGDVTHYQPSWSPDGKQITFIARQNDNTDIFIINDDGSEMRQLTNTPGEESSPRWSPNGKQIAYVLQEKSSIKKFIYLINTDGTHAQQLHEGVEPDWSPDGRFLAFSTDGITLYDTETATTIPLVELSSIYHSVDEFKWIPTKDKYFFSISERMEESPKCFMCVYEVIFNHAQPKVGKLILNDWMSSGFLYDAPVWGPDGKWFISTLETTNSSKGEGLELVVFFFERTAVNPSENDRDYNPKKGELITHNNFYDGDPDWTPLTRDIMLR